MSVKQPFVYPEMRLVFILLITCFAAWGVAANMTDPLVKVFSQIFAMSTVQSALVQFAYYGAYFCLAIPAAFINRRYSYKTGVLCGLGLAVIGALAFYPASLAMNYHYFLAALFILASGLSILETSANPFVMAMGPMENATRRLNLAQAFNPVGTNLGVFLAATLILPNLHIAEAADRALMTVEELQLVQGAELKAVMLPYVSMALALLLIWLMILFSKVPQPREAVASSISELHFTQTLKRLMANPHYRFGVIAQFFNVAAQVCAWTFTIQYVQQAIGGTAADASVYLQYSLLVFLVSRFAMTWLMGYVRPTVLMTILAITGSALCLFAMLNPTISGVWAVVSISACLSLMFPTIYGVALKGLGEDTKFGAAGLVMAILGGALLSLVQGAFIDVFTTAISYVVPGICFLVVAAYGYFDVRSKRVC
ncbi:L-fucose:H+ symporter permease [Methylophaga sp. UBA1464]|mgnify:CR=1 FL=1|uniref:L-fucose:H+ symporter permease n=1 Tax=Methylophaga sp. UBA1464 TaxID=1946866 RepID=UPI0025F19975|nr:L-fucose:H+ symporter permease [Methylophaga sp. UBA1464]